MMDRALSAITHMDWLTAFGLVAVSLMLLFYAIYGFLQGAWPFGLVEGVWSMVALRRWRRLHRA